MGENQQYHLLVFLQSNNNRTLCLLYDFTLRCFKETMFSFRPSAIHNDYIDLPFFYETSNSTTNLLYKQCQWSN